MTDLVLYLSELEAVTVEIATGVDLSPEALLDLAERRGSLLDRISHSGGLVPEHRERLVEIVRIGAEAERRVAVCRDSLRRQAGELERGHKLLIDLAEASPDSRSVLDLQA